jgi:hypothetical protein
MSSRLIRLSACPNSCSATERTGSTTLATSSEYGSSPDSWTVLSGFLDRAGGAQDIVCRHATAFARKFITAIRAADALEDAVAHQ